MTATTKLSSSTETVLRGVHQTNQEDTFARARKLLAEAIGIDSHIDTIQRVMLAAGVALPTNTAPTVLRNSDWEPLVPVKKKP